MARNASKPLQPWFQSKPQARAQTLLRAELLRFETLAKQGFPAQKPGKLLLVLGFSLVGSFCGLLEAQKPPLQPHKGLGATYCGDCDKSTAEHPEDHRVDSSPGCMATRSYGYPT